MARSSSTCRKRADVAVVAADGGEVRLRQFGGGDFFTLKQRQQLAGGESDHGK